MGATWDKQQGLTDHTIDTDEGIVAGLILKTSGAVVGYLWCTGQVWKWKSADGTAFGERQTKKAAVETLHDVRAAQTGQARSTRPPLPPPLATYAERKARTFISQWDKVRIGGKAVNDVAQPRARPTVAFAGSERVIILQNPEVVTPKRQVVWGDNDADGADLTAAISAALNKHKRD